MRTIFTLFLIVVATLIGDYLVKVASTQLACPRCHKTQPNAEVAPDGVLDDHGWNPMTGVRNLAHACHAVAPQPTPPQRDSASGTIRSG